MRDQSTVLKMNSEFVREGKALVDSLVELAKYAGNEEVNDILASIRSSLSDFESYGRIAEDVGPDGITDFDFYKGFIDQYNAYKGNRKRNLQFCYKGAPIILDSNYHSLFVVSGCLPCMQLLPSLLIDNAVKYSPKNRNIVIDIQDGIGKTITISNWGPMLEKGEEKRIISIDENYRGKRASEVRKDGHGIGLRLAQMIISSHPWLHAVITPSSSSNSESINGCLYSMFSIRLFFLTDYNRNECVTDTSSMREKLARYIYHAYIRVNPILCRNVARMADLVSRSPETSLAEDVSMKNQVFQLKSLMMEHLIRCHVEDKTFAIENDDVIDENEDRFDDELCSTINDNVTNSKRKLKIIRRGKGFSLYPMYTSFDVFFYLFADYVVKCCRSEELVISARSRSIKLFTPRRKRFKRYNDERFSIMEGILSNHGLRLKTCLLNTSIIIKKNHKLFLK